MSYSNKHNGVVIQNQQFVNINKNFMADAHYVENFKKFLASQEGAKNKIHNLAKYTTKQSCSN